MKRLKKLAILTLCTVTITSLGLVGCSSKKQSDEDFKFTETVEAPKNTPVATIVVKDFGTIKADLYPNIAPNTVNNFISLANSGYYNNLTFHRVIKGFMIQGGDPKGDGTGGPGYSIKGEFKNNGVDNPLSHTKGVLSMARSNKPDSAGSQFFIVSGKADHLDGDYAAFGKVTSGLEVVDEIEKVKTGKNDKPETPVVIESISVELNGYDAKEPEKK